MSPIVPIRFGSENGIPLRIRPNFEIRSFKNRIRQEYIIYPSFGISGSTDKAVSVKSRFNVARVDCKG